MKTFLFTRKILLLVGFLFLLNITFCLPQSMAAKNPNDTLTKEQLMFYCQVISENYIVPFEDVDMFASYHSIEDLDKYAFLAYASGRDMDYVIDMKAKNTWARTEFMLGLTPNELFAAKCMSDANKLYVGLKIDYTVALSILRQNFDLYETAMAMLIAESSKKAPLEIAKMKTPQMSWAELAKKNGVSEQNFANIKEKIDNCPNLNYLP